LGSHACNGVVHQLNGLLVLLLHSFKKHIKKLLVAYTLK